MPIRQVKVGLKLPIPGFGEGGLSVEGTWEASEREVALAWSVYVQLVSRIATVRLTPGAGSLHEALESLHVLFIHTRQALSDGGPEITKRPVGIETSLAEILLLLLNRTLRPILTQWHPLLCLYEEQKPDSISPQQYENDWELGPQLCETLDEARPALVAYARFLEAICDIRVSPLQDW
jgi:hypothetical protein